MTCWPIGNMLWRIGQTLVHEDLAERDKNHCERNQPE